jgi:hypothetical protein
MTLAEFKAWLDGFKEAVGEAPTPDQWQRITEKLATVYEPRPVLPAYPAQTYPTFPLSPVWGSPDTSLGVPGWLKGATLTNMTPLDAVASAAIFSDVKSLYQN